jgi:MYXO-CTERM domain-containing protein
VVTSLPSSYTGTQYVGFNALAVDGSAVWTVNGTNNSGLGWTLNGGTLSISSASTLGSQAVAFNGGTLQTTAGLTINNGMVFRLGGGTITASDPLTVEGPVSGFGPVTISGTLTLASTGTQLTSGAVLLSNSSLALDGGSITGSNGAYSSGTACSGGAGVVSTGGATITNAGSISGGLAAGSKTNYAAAVLFAGGANTLILESGYSFTGNVVSTSGTTNGGDTLELGGGSNATFNASALASAAPTSYSGTPQYYGFNHFEVGGTVTWTITGNVATSGTGQNVNNLAINSGATAIFTGTFSGAANVAGTGTAEFDGTLSPGDPFTEQFAGAVVLQSGNNLIMQIGGTTAGSGYDQIIANGGISLGGTLTVQLINGFTPTAGESFQLIDPSSISGAFSTLDLAALSSGLQWNTSLLDTSGVISVVATPEPAALALLAVGGGPMLCRRRHRSQHT